MRSSFAYPPTLMSAAAAAPPRRSRAAAAAPRSARGVIRRSIFASCVMVGLPARTCPVWVVPIRTVNTAPSLVRRPSACCRDLLKGRVEDLEPAVELLVGDDERHQRADDVAVA